MNKGEVMMLEELNAALRSWLDGYYHTREQERSNRRYRDLKPASSRASACRW
ncbi:hypothetical protein [Paenibacillus sp. HJGM_3]|uniref:hypothetical protein n=1 Tax=Paenibacillus sp. HJGM_3 TaxID=3379816 RepID=UPI00385C0767